MVTQPRRNCSSAQSALRDSLSGFMVNLRSPESAFNSFHYLSWQPMESSEKRAKKGYKKIDLGFNSEHTKEKMVWELHSLFKLMGKQQKPDRRWEWRQLWRREETDITVSGITHTRPVDKVRYICDKCLPSQFCLHARLERGKKWCAAREEAANRIAIKTSKVKQRQVRSESLGSPGQR